MIFVADQIPTELQRIVEFLSSQLDPAEVFAVEVKQYVGQEHKALVPRIVGKTAFARSEGERPALQWNAETIADALRTSSRPADAEIFRKILEWTKNRSLRPKWGNGKFAGSFSAMLDHNSDNYWTFAVWTYGAVSIQFGRMLSRPPFDSEDLRLELLGQLNAIPGINIGEDQITKYPSFPLSTLADNGNLNQFLAAFDWYVEQVRATSDGSNT